MGLITDYRLLNIMKLLYLHHIALDSQKANVVQVLQMCHAFQQANIDVTLAVPNSKRNLDKMEVVQNELGIDVKFEIMGYRKYGWCGRPMLLGVYWGVKRILENSSEYDYCYVRNSFLAKLAVKRGLKTIYEEHEQRLHHHTLMNNWYMKKLFEIINSDNLVRMVVISQALADIWREHGVASEKILALHDGFSAEDYKVMISQEKAREILGIKSEKKIVTYSGSLYQDRGIKNILRLAKVFSDVHFYIIGGPEKNKRLYEAISFQEGLKNIFFLGHISHYKVKYYLFAADILLMLWSRKVPTVDICSPLKMFEYMAAERIIVGHGFSVIKEVLTDGETALLAAPDSYEDLEKKLQDALFLNYPNNMAQMARANALNNYSWQKRVAAILEAIE